MMLTANAYLLIEKYGKDTIGPLFALEADVVRMFHR